MMVFRKLKGFLVGLVLATIVGVSIYFLEFKDPVLAQVGSVKIRQNDVAYRDQLIRLSFPNEKRSMGLEQLIKSAVNYEILKNYGLEVPRSAIEAEETRIDRDSKKPEELQKIKNIFGPDKDSYLRVFVLPTLVDRVIYYEFFLNDEEVQSEAMKKAMALIQKSRGSEEQFQKLAASQALNVRKLTVSVEKGLDWHMPRPLRPPTSSSAKKAKPPVAGLPANEEVKKWQELFLDKIKVGEVAPFPISYANYLLVARLKAKPTPTQYELEVAFVPKLEYGPWFDKEKEKISIKIRGKN